MSKTRSVFPYIFLLVLTALILDAGNPLFDKPSRDGGFFLYSGNQILNGKIPYVNFWDSKGPAIFYINALGLFLGRGSRWGVWGLEFIFILVWSFVLYKWLLKKWGSAPAVFGVGMAMFGLHVVFGYGNYTEEYTLLFNALALWLFLFTVDLEGSKETWSYFWIGMLFGISFSFRANNVGGLFGVLLSVFIFNILNHKTLKAAKTILFVVAGFIVPFLLWTLYFQIWAAAQDMIYASLIFNFSYASAKSRELIDYFGGFGRYGVSWYGWFAALGYLFYGYGVVRKIWQRSIVSLVDIFLLVWFPIEIFLSNLSGRNFSHYYITWTLAVAVYSAAVFAGFESYVLQSKFGRNLTANLYQGISLFLILGLLVVSSSTVKRYGDTFYKLIFDHRWRLEYSDSLSEYIRANTKKDDLVLTWYPETGINFMAQRASPVKLVYYPLFLEGTLSTAAENDYIKDLTVNKPKMIVDCSHIVDAIPSLDPTLRARQFSRPGLKKKMYIQPGMEKIFSFVSENYHIENTVESCIIFRSN